jgi:hypothetical protein
MISTDCHSNSLVRRDLTAEVPLEMHTTNHGIGLKRTKVVPLDDIDNVRHAAESRLLGMGIER